MVIHPLTPTCENGELTVAARIEWDHAPNNFPPTVWFKIPEAQAHLVSERADGFAIALLSPALLRGENIQLRGEMSSALAHGLQEYIFLRTLREPRRYKPVSIQADTYLLSAARGTKAASTFSGGIDSFYTVWSHIPQYEKFAGNELSFAIFVQGFDIGLHERHTFEECRIAYQKLMKEWGIELVTVRTNLRGFDKPENWVGSANFGVIGLGHILGRELAKYYVPANDTYSDYPKGAIAALGNGLLSSESLAIMEDGARLTRFEKTLALAQVPAAYEYLRTCSDKPNGLLNCCECGRCLNTMTALELAGTLQNFKTFPRPLDRGKLRRSPLGYSVRNVLPPYIKGALAQRRYDLAFDLSVKLCLNYLGWGPKWLKKQLRMR